MRRILFILSVLGATLGGRGAEAGPARSTANRAHLLWPVAARLGREAKSNVLSLVHYQGPESRGSGVVVRTWAGRRPGERRALVLTNNHVVHGNHDPRSMISFADGTNVDHAEVIAKNKLLDYALLEVTIPEQTKVLAARTSPRAFVPGERVYALGAATSMSEYRVRDFLSVGRTVGAALQRRFDADPGTTDATISLGHAVDGPSAGRHPTGERGVLQWANYASASGASGGPVFSSESHELLSLHDAMFRETAVSHAGSIPMEMIVRDLGKRLSRGKIAPAYQDTVSRFVDEAHKNVR